MVKKISLIFMFLLVFSNTLFAADSNFKLDSLGSPDVFMTFPDLSTGHVWVQNVEHDIEIKRVIILFFDKSIKSAGKSLGDDGVELEIMDLNCNTISKKKPKYAKSREYISYWACHESP